MQQWTTKCDIQRRVFRLTLLTVALCVTFSASAPLVWAKKAEMSLTNTEDFSSPRLTTFLPPLDELAVTLNEQEPERIEMMAIIPFISTDCVVTPQRTPERPTIAANDVGLQERPDVTAGVNVDLGNCKLNFGYTLPSSQIDSFIRPLGVNLDSGANFKRFSLGVKVPF